MTKKVLHEGRFLRFVERDTWEYVERRNVTGIVIVVAVTPESKLLLVEQFRRPLAKPVIELPAGLAGDEPGSEEEALASAARRELLEETGWDAGRLEHLIDGPTSAGLCSEVISIFRATELRRVGAGGGVPGEGIAVHEVPLATVDAFCRQRIQGGALVDPKVYAALWFVGRPERQGG